MPGENDLLQADEEFEERTCPRCGKRYVGRVPHDDCPGEETEVTKPVSRSKEGGAGSDAVWLLWT
jgi:hypothetical protein